MRLISAFIVLMAVTSLCGPAQCVEQQQQSGDGPVAGMTQVSAELTVRWWYHFDHNALKDARMIGRSLVALTESGNLLRFDADTLQITAQQVVPGRGASISAGPDQSLIAGTEDGRIYSVDPTTLFLKIIYEGRGRVAWVGYGKAPHVGKAIVAVLDSTPEVLPWPGEPWKEYDVRSDALEKKEVDPLRVLVHGNGKSRYFPFTKDDFVTPQTFLLDRGRLWMGVDKGEFGAGYVYMDLRTGISRRFKSPWGVLGFLRTSDGRLLSYGGTAHFVIENGFIADISKAKLRFLREFNNDEELKALHEATNGAPDAKQKQADPNLPTGPIELLIEDGTSGFFAVSEHIVYHINRNFTDWKKYGCLGGRWIAGRRYSVGNTPTVNQIFTRPGTGNLVAVMGRDGIVRLMNGNAQHIGTQGQMELPIAEIWPTSIGTVFLTDARLHEGWRLLDQTWQRLKFIPDEQPSGDYALWYSALPLVDDHGIVVYFEDNSSAGQRGFLKIHNNGKTEILWLWSLENQPGYVPGEIFLHAKYRDLRSSNGKDWQHAGLCHIDQDRTRMTMRAGRSYVEFGVVNGAEVFLNAEMGEFVSLAKAGRDCELRPLVTMNGTAPDGVFDAVQDRDAYVLAATTKGLIRFSLETGERQFLHKPNEEEEFKSLVRDGSGRLWVAGDSLYVSSDEGLHWSAVGLPMLCRTHLKRIRSNGSSGLMATLYDRGVVFLEW